MIKKKYANEARLRRHRRVRKKVSGTPGRPRLSVFRSATRIYAQIVDDERGMTLVAASSRDPELARRAPARPAPSPRPAAPAAAEQTTAEQTTDVPVESAALAGARGGAKGEAKGLAKGQAQGDGQAQADAEVEAGAQDPLRGIADNRRVAEARLVGRLIAERARARGIERVVFDRGGYLYHGRVAALATGAREGGLEF